MDNPEERTNEDNKRNRRMQNQEEDDSMSVDCYDNAEDDCHSLVVDDDMVVSQILSILPEETINEDNKGKRKRKSSRRMQNREEDDSMSVDCYDDNSADDHHSLVVGDDVVVYQILSRLPRKSLMRFKCVCKGWKSIVEHDSHFINLHHAHSQARPGLFIAAFSSSNMRRCDHAWQGSASSFFSADLHYDKKDGRIGASIHSLTRGLKSPCGVVRYLGLVEGLLCLADDLFSVQICNVSTGQATPWIKSAVVTNRNHEGSPRCHFGFDPSTGKHKVLHVWHALPLETYNEDVICEVLTVRDTRWRIIDDVPPCEIQGYTSGYANGSIYWITCSRVFPGVFDPESWESLVAFDVRSEKFRMIPVPSYTLWDCPFPLGFMEMDGCLAVIRIYGDKMKMWKFHDYGKESGSSEKEEWTEVDILLPSNTSYIAIFFHPVSGKDQMIIETYSDIVARNAKHARFYCYDLTEKTFAEFEIQGISSVPDDCRTEFATLVESLFPIGRELTDKQQT